MNVKKLLNHIELLFFAVIAILIIFRIREVVTFDHENFMSNYLYWSDDSYDWIANGVNLFKTESITYRNPGLPIIIKFLYALKAIYLLPVINFLTYYLLLIFSYKTVRHITDNKYAGLLITLFLFLNYYLSTFTLFILSDLYAVTFLLISIYYYLKRNDNLSFLFTGISMLFQNFGYFIYIILFLFNNIPLVNSYLKKKISLKELFKKALPSIIPALIVLPWHIYKFIAEGELLFTRIKQFGLLVLNFNAVGFYALGGFVLFGLAFYISIFGLLRKNTKLDIKDKSLVLVLGLFSAFFWFLLYDWNDRRFVLYLLPCIIIGLGMLLSNLKTIFVFLILPLIFFPTYFGMGTLEQSTVPILNTHILKFDSYADPVSGSLTVYSDFTLEKEESLNRRSFFPSTLSRLYFLSQTEKEAVNSTFIRHYQLILDYDGSNKICMSKYEGKVISDYIMNALMEIYYKKNVLFTDLKNNVKLDYDC